MRKIYGEELTDSSMSRGSEDGKIAAIRVLPWATHSSGSAQHTHHGGLHHDREREQKHAVVHDSDVPIPVT